MAVDPQALSAPILPEGNRALDNSDWFLRQGYLQDELARRQQAKLKADEEAARRAGYEGIKTNKYWDVDDKFMIDGMRNAEQYAALMDSKGINVFDKYGDYGAFQTMDKYKNSLSRAAMLSQQQQDRWQKAYDIYLTNPDKWEPESLDNLRAYEQAGDPLKRAAISKPLLVPKRDPLANATGLFKDIGTVSSTDETGDVTTFSKTAIKSATDARWNNYVDSGEYKADIAKLMRDGKAADEAAAQKILKDQAYSGLSSEYKKTLDEEKGKGLELNFGSGSGSYGDYKFKYQQAGKGIEAMNFKGFTGGIMPEAEMKKHDGILLYPNDNTKEPQGVSFNVITPQGTRAIDKFRPYFVYEKDGKFYAKGQSIYEKEFTTGTDGATTMREQKEDLLTELKPGANKENFEEIFFGGTPVEEFIEKSKAGKNPQPATRNSETKTATTAQIKSLVGKPGYEGYTEQELIDYYKSQGYTIE